MEIKPTDNLGASFLGRVGEQRVGGIFNSSDRKNFEKVDLRNRALKAFADRGIKTLDKAIDYKLEEEMIKGSTDALAGIAEEEMETNILTKNFRIAGHRNMSASLKHQQWQAGILDSIAKGEFNDLNPEEFGKKLNESIDSIMPDVRGMSAQARKSMLETILTGNQTLIAQQMKSRTESIVSAKMGDYSLQANNLLTEATLNKGTNLETATVQQVQALVRKIHTDENLPTEVKNKLIEELQTGSAKMGLVSVAQGILNAPIPYGEEGQNVPYGSTMSVKSFTAGNVAVNDSIKENVWEFNEQGRLDFVKFKAEIENKKFTGTEGDVVQFIRNGLFNKSITNAEATNLFKQFNDQKYLQDNSATIRDYWVTNNVAGMNKLGVTRKEGMEAYVKDMQERGLTLSEQVNRATSVFATDNGNNDIVKWVGTDVLHPILGEVINSEGEVLSENVELFNTILGQVDGLVGDKAKELYISNLLTSLNPNESDFVMEYISARLAGNDETISRDIARETYRRNVSKSEVERSESVKTHYKDIQKVVSNFSDPSFFGNILGLDSVKSWFGSDQGRVDKLTGTPTPFSTRHNGVVADRATVINANAMELANEYARANPESFTVKKLETHLYSELSNMIKGDGDNIVVFRGSSRFNQMFPTATVELMGQQDELTSYVLENLNLNELRDSTILNDNPKSFTFSGDLLRVTTFLKDGQSREDYVKPSEYSHLVEEYKLQRFDRSTREASLTRFDNATARMDFNSIGFDASFKYTGYDNYIQKYTPNFMEQLYMDNLPLEGWRLGSYADDPRGGNRRSVGMGVNSGNKFNADGSRNQYTALFEAMEKGDLTKEQAEEITEIAVKDHLKNSAEMIRSTLGREYVGASDDLDLAMFKLSYAQWKGDKTSTDKILEGVRDNDYEKMLDGLHTSRFFRDTAGGKASGAPYEYVLRKLIGAMDELHNRGAR